MSEGLREIQIAGTASKLVYQPAPQASEGEALWLPARSGPQEHITGLGIRGALDEVLSRINCDLNIQNYALLDELFIFNDEMQQAYGEFLNSYDRLEVDPHRNNGETDRRRAYQSFAFVADELYALPIEAYVPKHRREQNQYQGGKPRLFSAIEENLVRENIFLRNLIRLTTLMVPEEFRGKPLLAKVQQINMVAEGSAQALPTPEGMHHDGEDLIFVFLLGKTAEGGEVTICDREGNTLKKFSLEVNLSGYVLHEGPHSKIEHGVAPISNGDRKILIVNVGLAPEMKVIMDTRAITKNALRAEVAWHDVHLLERGKNFPLIVGNYIENQMAA